jgi:hypothetical protein
MEDRPVASKILDLVPAILDQQKVRLDVLGEADLRKIAFTEENVDGAVRAVRYLSRQAQALLAVTIQQRGMILTWMRMHIVKDGEWEKFIKERFPDIPRRTLYYWLARYREAVDGRKPKALAPFDAEELEDPGLEKALADPASTRTERAPRRALLDHIKTLETRIAKGREQLARAQEEKERTAEELRRERQSMHLPPEITAEAERVERIENEFWRFIKVWLANLPDDPERAREHKRLYERLRESFAEVWEDRLLPALSERCAPAGRKGGKG